jgi:8-oxo-dGTP diphosphatase
LGQRYRSIVDVHLLLVQHGQILLGERQNTGYQDGKYHLPAGHLEDDESLVTALVREADEELGITIDPDEARLAHLMHHRSNDGRIATFFEVTRWRGEPDNKEPDKCAKLQWFDLDLLPGNIIPYAHHAIRSYNAGSIFSLYGWD